MKNSSFSQVSIVKFRDVMTMLYSFHENLDIHDTDAQFEVVPSPENKLPERQAEIHLFTEKLCVPKFKEQILRPRLDQLLVKSSKQFGATLLLGRSGTGKTALAAKYSEQYDRVSWYSIESSDEKWNVFSKYFTASFNESFILKENTTETVLNDNPTSTEIAHFVESLLVNLSMADNDTPRLIVLDNTHYVFDSEWFNSFFLSLVYALSPSTHFLMLSRCEPSLPLWRLRSKQVLGVIGEKLLAFNYEETEKLFEKHPTTQKIINEAYSSSFGRISKLKEIRDGLTT